MDNSYRLLLNIIGEKQAGWDYEAKVNTSGFAQVYELPSAYKQTPSRFPHKCPICNGSGRVNSNTYQDAHKDLGHPIPFGDTTEFLVYCRSCEGEGIVWG